MNSKEKYWIAYYDTFNGEGYNATEGGGQGCKQSKETKRKKSEAQKGKTLNTGTPVKAIQEDTNHVIYFRNAGEFATKFGVDDAMLRRNIREGFLTKGYKSFYVPLEEYQQNYKKENFRMQKMYVAFNYDTGETIASNKSAQKLANEIGVSKITIRRRLIGKITTPPRKMKRNGNIAIDFKIEFIHVPFN